MLATEQIAFHLPNQAIVGLCRAVLSNTLNLKLVLRVFSMITATFSGTVAVFFYTLGTLYAARRLRGKQQVSKNIFMLLGLAALVLHAHSTHLLIFTEYGVDLGLFAIMSLIGCLIVTVVLLTSLLRPFENITVAAYPMAIIAILISLSFDSHYTPRIDLTVQITTHILLSIIASVVMAIALAQAALLFAQNYQLKHKRLVGLVQVLPPLQSMESFLFELIWIGFILLSLAIGTGFFFHQDMFAQQLAHKTFFTLAAWLTYGILLWGRHFLGWRGLTAIKFTLGGCVLLMVGFFGTKLVLEVILT